MTPRHHFNDPKIKKSLINLTGSMFIDDIVKNLGTSHKARRQTTIYGDKENELADIIVQNTNHEITDKYVDELSKII